MIGKWNKSVILSYVGLLFSLFGIYLGFIGEESKYLISCLVMAGICDMFDGTIARRCKRTKEEKAFGIELDSLIDVVSFGVFPIIIFLSLGFIKSYNLIIYAVYLIFAVARLANFNIIADNGSVKYYTGLPVTFSAIIFPLAYLLSFILKGNVFNIFYPLLMLLVGILFVTKIKVKKPSLVLSFFLLILGIILSVLYMVVL